MPLWLKRGSSTRRGSPGRAPRRAGPARRASRVAASATAPWRQRVHGEARARRGQAQPRGRRAARSRLPLRWRRVKRGLAQRRELYSTPTNSAGWGFSTTSLSASICAIVTERKSIFMRATSRFHSDFVSRISATHSSTSRTGAVKFSSM